MRYGTRSKLKPDEVIDRARDIFGPDGELGLPEIPSVTGGVTFGSKVGSVTITAEPREGYTDITVLSREYDSWAEGFIRELA